MSRKKATSAGLKVCPSTSCPSQCDLELGQDFVEPLLGDLHLIERLGGGEPRGRPLLRPLGLVAALGLHARAKLAFEERKSDRRAGGVAPLVAAFRIGPLLGLGERLGREDAVAKRKLARNRHIHKRAGQFPGHDLEMEGFAPDHAAERNRAVVRPAGLGGGVERDRDRRRNFERARDPHGVMRGASPFESARGAGEEVRADLFVIARLDDEEARPLDAGRRDDGALRLGHGRRKLSSELWM